MLVGAVSTFGNSPRMLAKNIEAINPASYQFRTASTLPRNFEGGSQLAFGMNGGTKLTILAAILFFLLSGCTQNGGNTGGGGTVKPNQNLVNTYIKKVINNLGLTKPYEKDTVPKLEYIDGFENLHTITEGKTNNPDILVLDTLAKDTAIPNAPGTPGTESYFFDNNGRYMYQSSGNLVPLAVKDGDAVVNGKVEHFVLYYDGDTLVEARRRIPTAAPGDVNIYSPITNMENGELKIKTNAQGLPELMDTGKFIKYKVNGEPVTMIEKMYKEAEYKKMYASFMKKESNLTASDRAMARVTEAIEQEQIKPQGKTGRKIARNAARKANELAKTGKTELVATLGQGAKNAINVLEQGGKVLLENGTTIFLKAC